MARRKPQNRTNTTIQIRMGCTNIFRKEKGTRSTTSTGLSGTQQTNDSRSDTITTDPRINQQYRKIQVLHQTGYPMGIQQYPNQRRRLPQGRLQNHTRTIRTNRHAIWKNKCPNDFSSIHELHIQKTYHPRSTRGLPGRYSNSYRKTERTSHNL